MKKIIFTILISFFILFILPRHVNAQQGGEITPTPMPGSLGGKCRTADDLKNDISDISGIPFIEEGKDEWGCAKIHIGGPFGDLNFGCLSSFFNDANQKVKDFLHLDEVTEELNKENLLACDSGLQAKTLLDSQNNYLGCFCIDPNTDNNKLCRTYFQENNSEISNCFTCFANGGYYSGFGCIYFANWKIFFEQNIFGTLIGLAGFIALMCIIYSAFQLQLSQGNAEKIKKSQELLTSCIMGLMLIIFSVFILRLIGVDILKIPGFGK